jgi:type II secretory pathway component GspD/PulD (secretin)
MKKIILVFLFVIFNQFSYASYLPNIYDLGFTKNFITVKDEKITDIIDDLSSLTNKTIILLNKEKNFKVHFKKPVRIYNIQSLNHYLLKNGYHYLIKVIKVTKNKIIVKIVPADELNAYDVSGVRLIHQTIKSVISKLNKDYWATIIYDGNDFKIPDNPNVVIKNLFELKKYLDATSPYSIMLVKSIDLDNDGIVDIEKYKEIINIKRNNMTPKEAIIEHLKAVLILSNQINNKDFIKKLFQLNVKQMIQQIENLK